MGEQTSRHAEARDSADDLDLDAEDAGPFARCEFDELKKNYRAVKEENFKLQAVITDVTEVNKRWQKYNNDRQLYVQRLLSTIQDQQEQMNKIVEERVKLSKNMGDCSYASPSESASVAPPAAAASETTPSLEALLLERQLLREEVRRLTCALETARREHSEHAEVLEFQLKAHRDDWEAERADKQQALHDKDAAERRARELQRDLRALKHKFREEKLQNGTHCKCCEAHVSEIDQCNIFLPGSQVNLCRRNHAKTYRTSVHVPCTSGPLLPRGTTIFFSDDLVVDGQKEEGAKMTELPEEASLNNGISSKLNVEVAHTDELSTSEDFKPFLPPSDGQFYSRSAIPEDSPTSEDLLSSFNIVEKDADEDSWDVLKKKHSQADLNREAQTFVSKSPPSVNISPSTSSNNLEMVPPNIVEEENGSTTNGVTIGFDNSGLASVMGFSHVPIAKSSSLPEKKELRKEGANPLVSRWSFDSYYKALPIVRPPSTHNTGLSMDSLIQDSQFQHPISPPTSRGGVLPAITQKPRAQKVKYSEEGVATQTEEDVICPGCGQIFPPKMHLKFLDHFEECQNNDRNKNKN